MVIDQSHLLAKMTEKIHEKSGVFVPPNSHNFSYVVSITLPQPTIRIKIPKVLVKAMQRRNQARSENDENGSKNKKKHRATISSKKSFRKKVGSMFSNVFSKNKKNGDLHSNEDDDEEMNKLKKMIENVDMGLEKIAGKNNEEYILNNGVFQQMAEDEGKEKPIVIKAGNGRNDERPKLSKGKNDLSVVCVGDKGGKTLGTKGIVCLKQAGNCNELTKFGSKTPKIGWSMKKISDLVGGKSGKQELCKKRILMGGKCKPLNHSGVIQYDENGVLIPEIIP